MTDASVGGYLESVKGVDKERWETELETTNACGNDTLGLEEVVSVESLEEFLHNERRR